MTTLLGTPAPGRRRADPIRRALHWSEATLLIAGLICFGWFGYNWIATEVDQMWSSYELDAGLNGEQASIYGFLQHIISGESRPAKNQENTADEAAKQDLQQNNNIPTGTTIGRIEIPALGISTVVRQGVDDNTLSRAAGHVPYTALPGHKGNVGIAAHRDSFFRNLRDVKEGDMIRMVTPAGTYGYQITSLSIVTPRDVEVLNPTPEPSITLVTCYPFNFIGHAPKRFIVHARQMNIQPPEAQAVRAPEPRLVHKRRAPRRRS